MGYLEELAVFPWNDNFIIHIGNEGSRIELHAALSEYQTGWQVYTCGAERYMSSVLEAARKAGFPEESLHLEYFSAPTCSGYRPDYLYLS